MADKFYDGMPNVNEELNKMNTAFEKGPYNALPLTGGNLTGPISSTSNITAKNLVGGSGVVAGGFGVPDASILTAPLTGMAAGAEYETLRLGVGNSPGISFGGFWSFAISAAKAIPSTNRDGYRLAIKNYDVGSNSYSGELFALDGSGSVRIPLLKCNTNDNQPYHVIAPRTSAQGDDILSLPTCAGFRVGSGAYGNLSQNTVLLLTSNTLTGRSLNAGGTINASGADYAEYMFKALLCGTIAPGQIVGIDADGRLTDKWDSAITFVAKSTNPCMVGGDSWAHSLGPRPEAPARIPPVTEQELVSPAVPPDEVSGTVAIDAVYRTIVAVQGDTDAEWASKEATHAAALAEFEAALERLRQTVDRIAFAGQVPVNVLGATPGQYIVPAQDGKGIAGIAVDEDDMTLKQYMRAIGKVIAIGEDGRARIIVKVA